MSTVPALVGIDVGTTGVKAIAISPGGEVLAAGRARLPALDALTPAGRSRTRRTGGARRSGAGRVSHGRAVSRIGLSGQMHGLVALDEADAVIRPAILWNDQRTGAECAEIEERVGLSRLIELTGTAP